MGGGVLASVYILQNRLEEAEALLADLPLGWLPALLSARLARIELAYAHRNPNLILQLLDEEPDVTIATHAAFGMLPYFQGPSLRCKAQALQWLGWTDEAEQTLLQTIRKYSKHGLTHGLWQIYMTLGRIYLDNSQPEQAREMFTLTKQQIDTLAATINDEILRETFVRRATALIPDMQPLTLREAEKQDFGGLTQRERQVAAVIAQGLSNQEIAESLVVSVKTVEAHITRILSKLGFHSRAQIAAWAVEKGLASAPQDLNTLSRGS
jgi:DNA-binding CsgD family transcriptional regulator